MKLRKICKISLCILMIILTFAACGGATIPALNGVDENTAKNVLLEMELIPAVKYEYSDADAEGCVIRTEPEGGTEAEKNGVVTLYISKGPKLTIPDIKGVDEATAKSILANNSLIPTVEYIHDDMIERGCVIKTEPAIGTTVEKNEKVTVYISSGPAYIEAADSRITWWSVSNGQDEWEFYNPYIEDEVLYIHCYNVVLAAKVKWHDAYNEGKLIGEATINDTYDKTIPVSAVYSKQEWAAGEAQNFVLEIPLGDLDVTQPTSADIILFAYVNGKWTDVKIRFTMTW